MSLKAMADSVRRGHQHSLEAAKEITASNKHAAARQWSKDCREAYMRSRSIFERAFKRQFSPHRFTYRRGKQNSVSYIEVGINYEGKLWAYVRVYDESGCNKLFVRPLHADSEATQTIHANNSPDKMYQELARLVEGWELA